MKNRKIAIFALTLSLCGAFAFGMAALPAFEPQGAQIEANAEDTVTIVGVTSGSDNVTYKDKLYNRMFIHFSTAGSNSALSTEVFAWMRSITLNGEVLYPDEFIASETSYYSSTYFSGNGQQLQCYYPAAFYKTDEVNTIVFPGGLTMADGSTTVATTLYGWLDDWYATESEAENALSGKEEQVADYSVGTSILYQIDSEKVNGVDFAKNEEVFQTVYVKFPVATGNSNNSDGTLINTLRGQIKLNGETLEESVANRSYFDPYAATEFAGQFKVCLPWSQMNWEGYDILEIPAVTISGTEIPAMTFYGRGGQWSSTENDPNLPQWQFAEIDEIFETNKVSSEADGSIMHDVRIRWTSNGGNSSKTDQYSLWYLRKYMKINDNASFILNGYYYDPATEFQARLPEKFRNTDGTPDELYIPKYFMVGDKVYLGDEIWYGRYGVWSKDVNKLPAIDDPKYVGSVVGIEEPYGVVINEQGGGYHRKLVITFSIPAGTSATSPNVDNPGYALYTLRREIKMNGENAIQATTEDKVGKEGNCYWLTDEASGWMKLQVYVDCSVRDPHGNDVITIPALRMASGKITKEQNLYCYDADYDNYHEWHLEPKDLQPYLNPVENGDTLTGSMIFERDCATIGAEVTTLDKISFNGKTVAEWNATETLITLSWTGENELSFVADKSVATLETLQVTLAEGFTFPTGETLRETCAMYYDPDNRFWVSDNTAITPEEWDSVSLSGFEKPIAQAGGSYQITINFAGSLVSGDNNYSRIADVTRDAYTLYQRSLEQVPGYYYDTQNNVGILEKMIRLGVRDSVLDGVVINGKTVREMLALESASALENNCVQIDFYGAQMQIFITGESASKLTSVEGLTVELKTGLTFESGRYFKESVSYTYANGAWAETVKTDDPSTGGEGNVNADETAANAVIALIDAIPANVTLEAKTAVNAAKSAYDALTEAQKALVPNAKVNKLNEALATIANLEKPADNGGDKKGGCASSIGLGVIATIGLGIGMLLRKKDEE